MEYSVHVIPIGEHFEPCLPGLHQGMPCHKVVLLNGYDKDNSDEENKKYQECEHQVRHSLLGLIDEVETVEIRIYDYQSIIKTMLELDNRFKKDGRNPKYYINVSSGTKVVTTALTTVAHFINAELYYILDTRKKQYQNGEEVLRIPILKIPDLSELNKMHKTVFLTVCERSISNSELSDKLECSKPKLRYYTRGLENWGLINSVTDGKEKYWHLTDTGKLAKIWIGEPIIQKKKIRQNKKPINF